MKNFYFSASGVAMLQVAMQERIKRLQSELNVLPATLENAGRRANLYGMIFQNENLLEDITKQWKER